MWTAFPSSDYCGPSVPSRCRQSTVDLPASVLAARRVGRLREGSHVHHVPVGRVGTQLFRCGLATATPQAFTVASWSALSTDVGVASLRTTCTAVQPVSTRLELVPLLSGFNHWFTYVAPICLDCRARIVWQCRSVPSLSGLLAAFPGTSPVRLSSSSPGCCDSPVGRSFHPTPVSWRLVALERVEGILSRHPGSRRDQGRLRSDGPAPGGGQTVTEWPCGSTSRSRRRRKTCC